MIEPLKMGIHRGYNRVMKIAAMVLPFPEPKLLTGPGSVKQLADEVGSRGLRHVLVVTDRVLTELKLPQGMLSSFEARGIRYSVFDDVQPNPTIENVEDGLRVYKAQGCDGIVAFGGGSPIDCAKVIGARVAIPFLSVRMMEGLFRVTVGSGVGLVRHLPPFFCVPTTAGTGSEVTVAAVITDAASHRKFQVNDLLLLPKVAVLDAELMVGLPPHITSTTGMDALTHAVEAYIGLNGFKYPDDCAEKATRLIFDNLEEAYGNGGNLEARQNMAMASYLGGAAFTRTYVGYVHAIAHNLGAIYGVPHGLANAVVMPHVLRFCRQAAEHKLAALAIAGGIGEQGESEEVLSHRFIEHVEGMNERMQIPTTIKELKAADIPLIAERALAEAHPSYPVPRIMTRPECEALIAKLLPS